MRILLLCHGFNSLTQRLHVELRADGHEVAVELDVNDRVSEEAVALWKPDLVIAPFLKRAIPESIWASCRCLVVHPGIKGDRGPSALDWAITEGEREWGVTVLLANAEMDAGDVVASVGFAMRDASKASLYRNEVTEAAIAAVRQAIERLGDPSFRPEPLDVARPDVRGRLRPAMRQSDRAIDWSRDDTATVARKVRAADGVPGVRDEVLGVACHLFDAHPEGDPALRPPQARPGDVIAQRGDAILRATRDGAVWITHLRRVDDDPLPALKLPATLVLGESRLAGVPQAPLAFDAPVAHPTWRPIAYGERGAVGILHFPFYNGAMSTDRCLALRDAVAHARGRPTRVLVLCGGADFWSNGIDLNRIEASGHPAEASWRNIEAMNDLVREIATIDDRLTIAAMQGNAGAGGCFLALAADEVWARTGVVLNPHYRSMGNLYGSEYWTYLLPRRVGPDAAQRIVLNRLPIGTSEARASGLIDDAFGSTVRSFVDTALGRAAALAEAADLPRRVADKAQRRARDEARKPLDAYRREELERMKLNFFGFDPSYHVARYHFVHKLPKARTPSHLAPHRAPARRATGGAGA
jgi:putative two-component system protein, hydrogenase maturation factor HypX/HoxX